jgi:hypothetical protein
MNISQNTLINWIKADSVQKTIITSDRVRAYISYEDIVLLADKHGCRIPDSDPTSFAIEVKKMSSKLRELISKVQT